MQRSVWTSGVVLVTAVVLFASGYLTGNFAPLPWLRSGGTPLPASAAPVASATAELTATPLPTATATPVPSVTPFPTPTERVVPRQPTRAPSLPPGTEKEVEDAFAAFTEVWTLIHANYLTRPVNDVALVRGAIRGMVRSLGDTFSGYNDPDEYQRLNDSLNGAFEGIGIEVGDRDGRVVIVAPMPGSPAEKAGLRAGDQIVRIDDMSIAGSSADDLGSLIRGPAGTTVRLTVQRVGTPQPIEVSIVRARIVTPNVETKELGGEAQAAGIAYVRINSFGQRSGQEFREALRQALAGTPRGLVLDLRGNPGGSLAAAVDIASQFLSGGIVLLQENADGQRTPFNARPNGLAQDVPLVVLVDRGSASASEIVAGAIQDRGRGILVGETTFGKGTVQDWRRLANNQGGLRLTTAHWLTPRGTWVHGQGIAPDVPVTRSAEDRAAGRDPQLERAVQELLQSPQP